jgi:hypothetical protein
MMYQAYNPRIDSIDKPIHCSAMQCSEILFGLKQSFLLLISDLGKSSDIGNVTYSLIGPSRPTDVVAIGGKILSKELGVSKSSG